MQYNSKLHTLNVLIYQQKYSLHKPQLESCDKLDILRHNVLLFCSDILHPEIGKFSSQPATADSHYYGNKWRSPECP